MLTRKKKSENLFIIFLVLFKTLRTIHNHFFEVILFERGGGGGLHVRPWDTAKNPRANINISDWVVKCADPPAKVVPELGGSIGPEGLGIPLLGSAVLEVPVLVLLLVGTHAGVTLFVLFWRFVC